MASNRIFDKETILDLSVNVIPLVIILFFTVLFLVVNPWGDLGLFVGLVAFGLLVIPFVGLALLTYLSGLAIAGDEKARTVFPPGQATVPGTAPMEHEEGETATGQDVEVAASGDDTEAGEETEGELADPDAPERSEEGTEPGEETTAREADDNDDEGDTEEAVEGEETADEGDEPADEEATGNDGAPTDADGEAESGSDPEAEGGDDADETETGNDENDGS
jgi:hypothetical protein